MSRSPNPQLLAVWQERMTRFAASDLSVGKFCLSEGISTPSFYRWRKKLTSPSNSPLPAFVPLTFSTAEQPAATLTLPGGASIDLPDALSRTRLTDLFSSVLEATASQPREASRC